jgi:glucan phosphoethanolaminetransferase (alkaline phosphatase superfamily)
MKPARWSVATMFALAMFVVAPPILVAALQSTTLTQALAFGLLLVASTALLLALPGLAWIAWVQAVLTPFAVFWVGFVWLVGDAPHLATLEVLWRTPVAEVLTWLEGRWWVVPLAVATSVISIGIALKVQKSFAAADLARTTRRAGLAVGLLCVMAVLVWHALAGAASGQQDDAVDTASRASWPAGAVRAILALSVDLANPSRRSERSAVSDPVRPVGFVPLITDAAKPGMLVVFVIGESQRADVLSPGRRPDLAPGLRKRLDAGSLVELTDVVSASNLTTYSVPAMLTGTPSSQLLSGVHGRPSGLGYFKRAGFFTAWISNQADDLFAEEGWDLASFPSSSRYVPHDDVLLSKLRQLLNFGGTHKAVVLHMMGSHFDYERRYPATFRPLPAASLPRPAYVRQNYENSVAYSADVLERVLQISLAASYPAVVIFSSDHGENLLDDERQLIWHGSAVPPSRHEFEPAAWIAWNEEWARGFPELAARVRGIGNRALSHEHLLGVWLAVGGLLAADGRRLPSVLDIPSEDLPSPGARVVFYVGKTARLDELK